MAAAKKKPWKMGASSGHIINLKQSILETFDIYVHIVIYDISSFECSRVLCYEQYEKDNVYNRMDGIENRAKCTGQCMMSQKAKAQYSLPPCSNQFRLAPF
jgi:hypothetical protein